jgi:hypothetical protein
MAHYQINIKLDVEASSKREAADFVKYLFADIGQDIDFSHDVDVDLFAEMGISYD